MCMISSFENELNERDMNISKIKIVSVQEALLLLSLFFYPLNALDHTLYLIPQAALTLMALWNTNIILTVDRLLVILFGTLAFTIPTFVEFSSLSVSFDLFLKLAINSLTIFALAVSPNFSLSENILKKIRLVVYAWLVIIFLAYAKGGLASLTSVVMTVAYGDSLGSSALYGAASPLSDIFLTKNISAMFMVAVFAFYIYLSVNFNKKVSNIMFITFFILIMSFLSRQGLIGFLGVLFLYKFRSFGVIGKGVTIASAFIVVSYIFKKLFDLSSSEDGANERIILWKYFFNNYGEFILFGLGQNELASELRTNIGIDNFHMFFMNQIGAYGIFHFVSFSIFLFLIYNLGKGKFKIILVAAYFLNVLFQTFGYEFGNLFLFMVILMNLKELNSKNKEGKVSRRMKYKLIDT